MKVSINALDSMDSPLWTNANGVTHNLSYSPFGNTFERSGDDSLLPGFNGERLDPVGQSYNLGNGYRTYNPTLMRFNAPDSWSPFGSGGLNQYAYCEGDPINRSDPSGHMSWQAGVGIGLGILGALGAIFTFGQSIAAAAAAEAALTASMAADLIATGLGVAASVTGIASTATQESDPEASRVLGWVSFGLGIASFATHTGNSIESKLKGRSGSYDLSHSEAKGCGGGSTSAWEGGSAKSQGAQEIGKHFYLFKGSENSDRLILTNHAVQDKRREFAKVPKGSVYRLFCPEGTNLKFSDLDAAARDIYEPYERVSGGKGASKYYFGKYYGDHYNEIKEIAEKYKVDILTVRNRRGFRAKVSNADAFYELDKADIHYKVIDGLHCRSIPKSYARDYEIKCNDEF